METDKTRGICQQQFLQLVFTDTAAISKPIPIPVIGEITAVYINFLTPGSMHAVKFPWVACHIPLSLGHNI